ncbi:hypothetical protein [Burkholderia vietnamiensis]|uniref:hypothetical protein n=1 Tax=Burkholderia vietnamiensis TaxID=60552 RepID=UPI001592FF16|nr:hypothetical protein [Burkholderia vietnamiensis]HDR9100708.1 hypothetical protein [Burkholderia vietnamiensis]
MKLKNYIDQIKCNPNYKNKDFKGNFPNPSSIKDKPQQHLNIIVEQAERVIAAIDDPSLYVDHIGILPSSIDLSSIAELFAGDIKQFATENPDLDLIKNGFYIAQSQLPGYTLFRLSRSKLLPDTYGKYIELLDQENAFSLYSVPFIVRLAIESKLKGMVGFKSSNIRLSDGQTKVSNEFPALKIINFLISSNLIESSLPFGELKKIYNWSCGFVHTGKKEYIWMSLKAISCLNVLFSKDYNQHYGDRICYLKSDVTLARLQSEINASPLFSRPSENKVTEEAIELNLSEDEFDVTSGFWDKRKA